MRKKILSYGISVGALITISWSSAFALTPSQASDQAIQLTKAAEGVNYGKITLPIGTDRYETIWFATFEREGLEGDFIRLVLDSYSRSSEADFKNHTGVMEIMRSYDTTWLAQMASGALSTKERAKAIFRDKLYTSLRQVRGNPDLPVTPACTQDYTPVCAVVNGNSNQTFSNMCSMHATAQATFLYTGSCVANNAIITEGNLTNGTVAPRYQMTCKAGLTSLYPYINETYTTAGGGNLCYDPNKSVPTCKIVNNTEGRYYTNGTLLRGMDCDKSNGYSTNTDSHGCLTTAGYTRDSVLQSCVYHSIAPTPTYTRIENYTTVSGKDYTIRRTADGKYRFRKNAQTGYGFTSLSQIKNFLERQNRILYMAPNGRMYGIFLSDGVFYFNRDEGSVSTNSWANLADVKAYINQHNQPTAGCSHASNRKCY